MGSKVTVYLDDRTEEHLATRLVGPRESRSGAIGRAMDRYVEICRRHLPSLTDSEWSLVAEALSGPPREPASVVAVVEHEIEDEMVLNDLASKHGVSAPRLMRKLNAMDYANRVALVDAVESGLKP